MLILNNNGIAEKEKWEKAGIKLPNFDRKKVADQTRKQPQWIHFGAGNIFRGFIANAHQKLLDEGLYDTGIIAVDSFDFEVIEKVYQPFDNLSLLVLMNANGDFEKKVIGSISESIAADYHNEKAFRRLYEVFENPELQMVSFTITEKGYALRKPDGEYFDIIKSDIKQGPLRPVHTMSMIAGLMYKRYKVGAYPVTLVSMDNCSHNGDKLKNAVISIAEEWLAAGHVSGEFVEYLKDHNKVTYPLSMIDKITPRPSEVVKRELENAGVQGMDTIITDKKSYMAPFVNAEKPEYLVIEDTFTNGRPPLEKAGVIFTDRDTVNKVETMKVTTCLNPLHTALAVSGCLLGYELIADEMKDKALRNLIETIGYEEGLKVVVDPGIIQPQAFIDEVIKERFSNPYIPDTPQRIATDTSQKVGIRFGETIKSYVKNDDLNPKDLTAIPMAIALWCRYLLGIDDVGNTFTPSPDPLLEELRGELKEIELGMTDKVDLSSILANVNIFGLNLYEVGLGHKIEDMFMQLISSTGAVRKTLNTYFDK